MAAKKSTSYWLVKTEPGAYSWDDLVKDGSTYWDGVRNSQARNNLRDMAVGDQVLVYHSVNEKAVVGIAKVAKAAYQDPTTDDDRWVAVDIVPAQAMTDAVTLAQVKADAALAKIPLVTHSRLSVMPLGKKDFERILKLGNTKPKSH
jgi:predicted RNA-binding protein with PUA-like domain